MKTHIFILLFLPLSLIGQNTVCFNIEVNPNPNDPAFSLFTKYIYVLGCFSIYAENNISDEKILHAAAIAAELLDNNEDGIVDDILVRNQLINNNALMPIFSSEGSSGENIFFNNYNGNGVSAVLYRNEIDPSQPGKWGYDATVEEVLHTINDLAHTNIYSSVFSLLPNSSLLSDAMDVARGGQFLSIPNPYPLSSWYHYDDPTCDYECMAIEYIYWAIVSNMGVLNDPQTALGISDEWELYSAFLLQSTDTLIYNIITNPQFSIPQLAPDGNYCPNPNSIIDIKHNSNSNIIVDVLGKISRVQLNSLFFKIYDDGRVEKRIILE